MPVEPALAEIAPRLLAHYDRHARTLPWRAPPGASLPDPYRVWLSEIMLQQTTVAAVAPYFMGFTARWPTVEALAAADDADVMAAWAGLGYYARARNLLACARVVAGTHRGRFPDSEEGLRTLPGVGAYTAAAIAAIAFGRRAVVIDANVERVVARLFNIGTPMSSARAEIRIAADAITPDERSGDFAQAMMDLGATICVPRAPACLACPLSSRCAGLASGDPARLPVKGVKRARPHRMGHAWWIERADGHVWLTRRPDKGLLGGMRALPSSDWGVDPPAVPPLPAQWRVLPGPVEHVFTHFSLALTVHSACVPQGCVPPGAGEWWPLARIEEAGLPTLFRRAVEKAMDERRADARQEQ
ncbi:MAG: A/G-specific adenine glycosylase [Sphingobium sp.]